MNMYVNMILFVIGCLMLMVWAILSLKRGKQYKDMSEAMGVHAYQVESAVYSSIQGVKVLMEMMTEQHNFIMAAFNNTKMPVDASKLSFDQLNSGFPLLAVRFAYAVWRDPYAAYVWKSLLRNDSTPCEDFFILGIGSDPDKQILFEIPISLWDDAEFAKELPTALPGDDHSFTENMSRLNLYIRF